MYWEDYILYRNSDYRLVLNLEGVCRFVLHERNLNARGYYQASIDCMIIWMILEIWNQILTEKHLLKNTLIFLK